LSAQKKKKKNRSKNFLECELFEERLSRLLWIYDNELLMGGVSLADQKGGEKVVLNLRELLNFHQAMLVSVRLARKSQLDRGEPVLDQLLEMLEESTQFYMEYATGYAGGKGGFFFFFFFIYLFIFIYFFLSFSL
jgi:hypothetical protein